MESGAVHPLTNFLRKRYILYKWPTRDTELCRIYGSMSWIAGAWRLGVSQSVSRPLLLSSLHHWHIFSGMYFWIIACFPGVQGGCIVKVLKSTYSTLLYPKKSTEQCKKLCFQKAFDMRNMKKQKLKILSINWWLKGEKMSSSKVLACWMLHESCVS